MRTIKHKITRVLNTCKQTHKGMHTYNNQIVCVEDKRVADLTAFRDAEHLHTEHTKHAATCVKGAAGALVTLNAL
jgi:hypothetical protein